MTDIDKILDPDLYEPEIVELFKSQQAEINALSKAVEDAKAKEAVEAAKPRDEFDFDESSETPMPANYAHALKKLREREAAANATHSRAAPSNFWHVVLAVHVGGRLQSYPCQGELRSSTAG